MNARLTPSHPIDVVNGGENPSSVDSGHRLVELLSYSVARQQQYMAMFDQAAVLPVVIEQRDLLSRIRGFFRLSAKDRASMAESSPVSGRRFCRLPADDS